MRNVMSSSRDNLAFSFPICILLITYFIAPTGFWCTLLKRSGEYRQSYSWFQWDWLKFLCISNNVGYGFFIFGFYYGRWVPLVLHSLRLFIMTGFGKGSLFSASIEISMWFFLSSCPFMWFVTSWWMFSCMSIFCVCFIEHPSICAHQRPCPPHFFLYLCLYLFLLSEWYWLHRRSLGILFLLLLC